jgi:uncharacterized damage-inducible protein DinB
MPMPVAAFFRQSSWASQRLIEVCESLSDQQLDTPANATYGSIRETLVHLVATEQRYIRRLGGAPPSEPVLEDETPGLDVLKRATRASGETLARMAASASPAWLVSGVTEYGLKFETEATVFLLQTVNHSTEHRTQVISILSTLGLGSADLDEQLDAWAWGEATGALRTQPA